MKLTSKTSSLVFAIAAAACAAVAFGQAPAAPTTPAAGAAAAGRAAGGGGGGGGGGGRGGGNPGTAGLALPMPEGGLVTQAIKPNELNDVETTAITRWELNLVKQVDAQRVAREAANAAAFMVPANSANITAKIDSLAKADLDLAMARAESLGKLKAELQATPAKMQSVVRLLSGGGGGGRGGG